MTFVTSNPPGTLCRRIKLSTSNPALASKTIARTISTTTSAARVRCALALSLPPRGASLSDTARFERDARHAGNKLEVIPTPRLATAVTTRTRGSGDISSMRGMLGRNAFSESMLQIATTNPARPPRTLSKVLSPSNCSIIRQRPAPSAARILISRLRESERASNRFATLTQATSSTQPAIAHNISNAECVLPIMALTSGMTFAPVYSFESGYC